MPNNQMPNHSTASREYHDEAYRLGNPTHRARASRWPGVQLGLGRGLGLLIIMAIVTTTASVFFAVMGAWLLFEVVMFTRSRVHLLLAPGGVVHIRNRKITLLPWADIRAISRRVNRVDLFGGRLKTEEIVFRLALENEQSYTFSTDTFPALNEFGDEMLRQHAAVHWPLLLAAFEAGEPLAFGHHIRAEREGLYIDGERIRWQAVDKRVAIDDIALRVQHTDNTDGRLATGAIPNVHLLQRLMAHCMSGLA